MITRFIFGFALLHAVVFTMFAQKAQPEDEHVKRIVERMGGWLAVSAPKKIALLSEEERQVMIRYYRGKLEQLDQFGLDQRKKTLESSEYRQELLMLGDAEVLAETAKVVIEADNESPEFVKAAGDLVLAARPESVAMLAPGMLVDEPFIIKPMRGDVGSTLPKPYGIANALLQIMARSPAFAAEVRKWADDNWKVRVEKILPMMREWWKENEQFFRIDDYKTVRPGKDLRATELAQSDAVNARQQAYRDDLIARGQSPADLANWEQWRTVIYPSLVAASPISSPKAVAAPTSLRLRPVPQTSTLRTTPAAGSEERKGGVWLWFAGIGALLVFAIIALAWKSRS